MSYSSLLPSCEPLLRAGTLLVEERASLAALAALRAALAASPGLTAGDAARRAGRVGALLARACAARGDFAVAGLRLRVLRIVREEAARSLSAAAATTPAAASPPPPPPPPPGLPQDGGGQLLELLGGSGDGGGDGDDEATADAAAAAAAAAAAPAWAVAPWRAGTAAAAEDALAELEDELDNAAASLALHAADLLRPAGEVLLLFAPSAAVVAWLLEARRAGRRFSAIVCEGEADGLRGHEAAARLAAGPAVKLSAKAKAEAAAAAAAAQKAPQRKGGASAPAAAAAAVPLAAAAAATALHIPTTLVPDAAAWAVMSQVTRVVLSCAAVAGAAAGGGGGGGGVLCRAGALAVALAARAHAVPVLAFAPSLAVLPVSDAALGAAAALYGADPVAALGLSFAEAAEAGLAGAGGEGEGDGGDGGGEGSAEEGGQGAGGAGAPCIVSPLFELVAAADANMLLVTPAGVVPSASAWRLIEEEGQARSA
jgi:translation initiation factor 2B subunit (eIF-2B alpha/beta/delta family)